ncbi:serine carboxypeptidase [Trifolium repens]|nr:serine carboxypeptidase [Trifolium repens]
MTRSNQLQRVLWRTLTAGIEHTGEKIDVCQEDRVSNYLNRKDVQQALHVNHVGVDVWSTCSGVLVYDFSNLENPTTSMLRTLVKAGVRVLAYSGDKTNSVIPLTGTKTLLSGLTKDLVFNTTEVGGGIQVNGEGLLAFARVRGGGHVVPFTQLEPGCSSVGQGAFKEHDPFKPTKKGLVENPYSWNREANIL